MIYFAFLSFFLAFVCTFMFVPCAIKIAQRVKIIDYPNTPLKTHANPTPYLGGLAVYGGMLISFFVLGDRRFGCSWFAAPTLALFVGLFDDFFLLTPLQKFLGQAVDAGVKTQIFF